MGRLQDKVAIVTGGGSGIGRACAELFVREGARVLVAGRGEEALRAVVSAVGEHSAAYVVADVSTPEGNRAVFDAASRRYGGIDVFVANAGIEGPIAPIADYPLEAFDEVMAVNVRGVFLGLKQAVPALRKRGGGSIVIMSSIGGIRARGLGNSAYLASKHAEIGLMRSVVAEGAAHGIRVNCVLPGPTETRMMRSIEAGRSPGAPDAARAAIIAGLPMKRYGTPAEVAELVVFLASDAAGICTGGVFSADGGLSAI